eukprot:gene2318-2786_t
MNNTQQFAWHSSDEFFGTITDNNHILIFDTKTNEKLQDFVLPFNLSTTFTSISFSPTKQVKKNKKKSKGAIFVACGTSNGKIVVWNITKGDLLCQLETGDAKETFVDFSDASNLLVSTKNLVGTFFVSEEASSIQKLKIGKENQIGGVKSLEKYFVVGTSNFTTLFEKTSRKKTSELQGHSSEGFLFASSGDLILTAAKDNFMNLFSLDSLSKKMNPIQILSLEDYPSCVDIRVKNGIVDVLALTHKGVCLLWRLTKFGKKGLKSDGKIIKEKGLILSAKFSKDKNTILIATGSNLNPFFEEIEFLEDEKVIKSIKVSKKIVEKEAPTFDDKATILGSINMESEEARFKSVLGSKQNGHQMEDTYDDKIEDIDITFKENDIPKVSIAPTLSHALKFNDKPVIINCLEQNNEELIKETVSLLPSKLSITLLDVSLEAYQNQNISSSSLVKWTRSILLYHASTIMSHPNILKKLSPLYHSLNSKLETYTSLLDLSGRLDLVLGLAGHKMIGLDGDADDVDTNIESSTDDEPLQLEDDLQIKEASLNIYGDDDDEDDSDLDEDKGGFGNPDDDSASDLEFPEDEGDLSDEMEEE